MHSPFTEQAEQICVEGWRRMSRVRTGHKTLGSGRGLDADVDAVAKALRPRGAMVDGIALLDKFL